MSEDKKDILIRIATECAKGWLSNKYAAMSEKTPQEEADKTGKHAAAVGIAAAKEIIFKAHSLDLSTLL